MCLGIVHYQTEIWVFSSFFLFKIKLQASKFKIKMSIFSYKAYWAVI